VTLTLTVIPTITLSLLMGQRRCSVFRRDGWTPVVQRSQNPRLWWFGARATNYIRSPSGPTYVRRQLTSFQAPDKKRETSRRPRRVSVANWNSGRDANRFKRPAATSCRRRRRSALIGLHARRRHRQILLSPPTGRHCVAMVTARVVARDVRYQQYPTIIYRHRNTAIPARRGIFPYRYIAHP